MKISKKIFLLLLITIFVPKVFATKVEFAKRAQQLVKLSRRKRVLTRGRWLMQAVVDEARKRVETALSDDLTKDLSTLLVSKDGGCVFVPDELRDVFATAFDSCILGGEESEEYDDLSDTEYDDLSDAFKNGHRIIKFNNIGANLLGYVLNQVAKEADGVKIEKLDIADLIGDAAGQVAHEVVTGVTGGVVDDLQGVVKPGGSVSLFLQQAQQETAGVVSDAVGDLVEAAGDNVGEEMQEAIEKVESRLLRIIRTICPCLRRR